MTRMSMKESNAEYVLASANEALIVAKYHATPRPDNGLHNPW